MKKTVKFGLAAFAIAASASVFAQNADVEIENENEYEAIGWTPVAIGLASPVQLPWGCHKWDVFGLDISAIWADNCKMYGLGVSGIAMATRGDMMGLQVAGLCNWATAELSIGNPMEHVEMLKMWMENGMVAIINGIECATSEM